MAMMGDFMLGIDDDDDAWITQWCDGDVYACGPKDKVE